MADVAISLASVSTAPPVIVTINSSSCLQRSVSSSTHLNKTDCGEGYLVVRYKVDSNDAGK